MVAWQPVLWVHHSANTGWGKCEGGWRQYDANILSSRPLWIRSIIYRFIQYQKPGHLGLRLSDLTVRRARLEIIGSALKIIQTPFFREEPVPEDVRPHVIVSPVPNRFFTCSLASVRSSITFWHLKPHVKLHLTNAEVGMWNAEGWSHCALPFEFIKIDRMPSFRTCPPADSTFFIQYSTCLKKLLSKSWLPSLFKICRKKIQNYSLKFNIVDVITDTPIASDFETCLEFWIFD